MQTASPFARQAPPAAIVMGSQASTISSNTDYVLLERIAAGDQLAMRTLFARHSDTVFRFILRLTRDRPAAEDALSETFLSIWRFADRFEARSTVSTWLLAIARNKALSAVSGRAAFELSDEMALSLPDPAADPETALASKDAGRNLRRCLMQLSPKHTEVIDLVYYHGKTIAEAAEVLGISEATVKTRMFYARRKLAQLLGATAIPASAPGPRPAEFALRSFEF
jgi:RNA polymerase sigma-70 factor (ECF subfamily)